MDKDTLRAIEIIRDILNKYVATLAFAEDPIIKIKELDKIINDNKEK